MPRQQFDIGPVYHEMVTLYDQRTKNPQVQYAEAEYRVGWTDISACMTRHGYTGDVVDARRLWDAVAPRFNTACRKILEENGEDPKKIRRRQNWKSKP